MSTISRQLPNSNPKRRTALKAAKTKRDNSPIATDVLRASTIARLDIVAVKYNNAQKKIDDSLVLSTKANAAKDLSKADLHLFAGSYIIVLNQAIRRNEIPKEDRAYYELDINSDVLPYMDSEEALKQVGENIIDGDAKRVLAGGVPMTNPTAAQVKTKYDKFVADLIVASERTDELDQNREDLEKHNPDADEVILSVWDEVESYYNKEPIESKRANAREWGVVYVSTGAPTQIDLTVLQKDGTPAVNFEVSLEEGKGSHTTDDKGAVSFSTTLNGELTVLVLTDPATQTYFEQKINVIEGVAFKGVIQLK